VGRPVLASAASVNVEFSLVRPASTCLARPTGRQTTSARSARCMLPEEAGQMALGTRPPGCQA
jgi:hypothetical protein